MTDRAAQVFLSYSRQDMSAAQSLASALTSNGLSVWWDEANIPVGARWQDYLTEQISRSACVIVLWSRSSVRSDWVLSEAQLAHNSGTLLPVVIDDISPPAQFSDIVTAKWNGDPKDKDFRRILTAVRTLTEPAEALAARTYKESKRIAERRSEQLFQNNLQSDLTIDYIALRNSPLFGEVGWNVTPDVNVLLGRNGYGKTFFLRTILAMLIYNDRVAAETIGSGTGTISILLDGNDESIRYSEGFFDESSAVGQLPILAIPDVRFVSRAVTTLTRTDNQAGGGDRADLPRFGAKHFVDESPFEELLLTFFYGLCLDYFESGRNFTGEHFALIRDVVRELTDQTFEFDSVVRDGRDRFTLYVRTEGNSGISLPIQRVSQGTTSVIALVGLIYSFLAALSPRAQTPVASRRGIVVIDEIDAHLHPVWQQKIVGILRRYFPRVQFILTAHNPIVVAGCREDEVSVLRKDPERGFSLFQFPNDFIGWQTEDIYRKVFDIESPDTTFVRYDAMRPFKNQIKEQVAALASQLNRSADEERSLRTLEDDVMYIEKVEQGRAQRLTIEDLQRQNSLLKDRVQSATADLQTELNALRADVLVQEERAALYGRSVWIGVWSILSIQFLVAILWSLFSTIA